MHQVEAESSLKIFKTVFTQAVSCPKIFCNKSVLKNFAKATGKHLSQILGYFFDEAACL